jgi:hypothetical protein
MFPASEVLLAETANGALEALEASPSSRGRSIARRVRDLRPILLANCLHGEVVRKGAIPGSLRKKYGLENLYVEDLPDFWRLLYTVVKSEGRRVILVLEIVSHKDYDRWFPGRRR